ncbi:MAG: sporulation protein [Firmicutes bacterium]|nr:sporulation protein [Bacillota bacterium]
MLMKLIKRTIGFFGLFALALVFLFFADDIFIYREPEPAGLLKEAEMKSQVIDFSFHVSKLEQELDFEVGPKERPKPEPKPAPTASGSGSGSSSSGAAAKEQQMVGLINQARANAGLPPLQVSSQLTNAARAKSRDMIEKNYFSHTSPTYGSFTDLLNHFGISYRSAAENLAMNSNGSVTGAHDLLMASPGHRTNILGGSYSLVGVGIQVRSDGSHFYTQLFVGY